MNAIDTPEYRKLALDSSNDLIRHDARRGDRKYPEAIRHAREAGRARLLMGQMMFDADDFTQAAADWLSASACFLLVGDPVQMRAAFERAQALVREGKVPPERRDIHAALKERAERFAALNQKSSPPNESDRARQSDALAPLCDTSPTT